MLKKEFNSSTLAPKFELSNDPEHFMPFSEFEKFYERALGSPTMHRYKEPLRRVRALKDFGNVRKGDIGGYLQNEDFLDQRGNCWIYDDACIVAPEIVSSIDGSPLTGIPTLLYGNAQLRDQAVFESGRIGGDTIIRGTPICIHVNFSGRTSIGRRRLPYFLSGEIHDNFPDNSAMATLRWADFKQAQDSFLENPKFWRGIWDEMKLVITETRMYKRKEGTLHRPCTRL
jgi:hypothetical protein